MLVEVPVYVACLRYSLDLTPGRSAMAGIGVNLFSHPLGFLVIAPALSPLIGETAALALAELWAWASEALLLWLWLRRRGLELVLVSLSANGASLAVGVALSALTR